MLSPSGVLPDSREPTAASADWDARMVCSNDTGSNSDWPILTGILQSGEATNLVFDMESEYGWRGYSEANLEVKGLKQLFPSKVAVFSLDEESSRRRGLTPDYVVRIGYEEVEPDDLGSPVTGQTSSTACGVDGRGRVGHARLL